jgi:hypothetical protein
MLTVDVKVSRDVYESLANACGPCFGEPARLPGELSAALAVLPGLGRESARMAATPGTWFDVGSMAEPGFWDGQRALCDYIVEHVDESVAVIAPYFPHTPDARTVPVMVHPVPGLTGCYGLPAGGQLFGLFEGADAREMLLFLSHTYYHELSETLHTENSRRAEADHGTAGSFRTYLLQLIRNEGIANYAVLAELRRLRADNIAFRYFTYAGLIDNPGATARAMAACRQLLTALDEQTVEWVSRRVSATLKNPRLPVINLIGIHMADAVAAHHGERALLDVDQREPEEFVALYAESGDALVEELLGAGREATPAFLGGSRAVS